MTIFRAMSRTMTSGSGPIKALSVYRGSYYPRIRYKPPSRTLCFAHLIRAAISAGKIALRGWALRVAYHPTAETVRAEAGSPNACRITASVER